MFVGTPDGAIDVTCPYPPCAARPGKWCVKLDGTPAARLHKTRRELASIDWTEATTAVEALREKSAAYYAACAERGAAWAALRAQGVTTRQIAEHFDLSHEQVQRAITRVRTAA